MQQLRMLGQVARQYGCKGVEFYNLAYQSTLARCIRRGRYEVTIEKARNGRGNPMRIINLESTLSKMAGELSQRLQAHGHGNRSGQLRIAVGDQAALLTAKQGIFSVSSDGKTSHTIEGSQEIVRLLVGTDGADEVVAEGGIQLSGDAEWLVRVLFPPQHPVLPNEYL